MSELRKYIVLSDGTKEYAVIFDATLSHIDVARGIARESAVSEWSKVLGRLEPVSAGFVSMPECTVTGRGSESLKLEPRAQDQALIRGERAPTVLPVIHAVKPKPYRSVLERSKSSKARL